MRLAAFFVTPVVFATSASALDLTVESFRGGQIPTGYTNVADGIEEGETTRLSEDPWVDYLIPNNSGSAGITAQKAGADYIADSTVGGLTGGANAMANPDIYQVVFAWQDGTPLPFGSDYYGVSWGGWSASASASLTTRIDLVGEEPLRIYHWFNDGWDYDTHDFLDGHNLEVTHYDADGTVLDRATEVLPSGGAEDLFGDHRQFYTAMIDVQRAGEGEYVLISQEAGNIGYKGTAVAVREADGPEPGTWVVREGDYYQDPNLGWTYGLGDGYAQSTVLGLIYYLPEPWFYHPTWGWIRDLQQTGQDIFGDGVFYYSPLIGFLYVQAGNGGWFYSYAYSDWDHFTEPVDVLPRP